ncbi:DUF6119 family protein [Polaribacter sp. AHE13PA]|uniref:DUF6119 family protein n=1 Tax=Polaribacter sp. AHE13PA TaxID=2745562 RepID=UPI001C4F680B|nr:DUF6119 family protein [Polaribacter sp. AHE13PA]QXP68466.1 TIGR04141 family sporadically distributed protein [Polaribacter sp. AHE13PA]
MKQNPTIYKIKPQYPIDDVFQKISEQLHFNGKIFTSKDLEFEDYEGKLIVIESDEKSSEWATFFPEEFVEGLTLTYKMPSLLFLINTINGIYAIVGGGFYKYVIPYLDTSFGLNTYSRIMNPTRDEIITIKTRGVTGMRAGMSEQFKDNYRIMDYIKFGKIPTELKIKLANETVDLYFSEFINNRSPYIILNISSGFNINKKLNYTELELLISILIHIEQLPPNDFFSSYKEITDARQISTSLKPALINELFNKRAGILNNEISLFDICYPNKIEDFYSADEYEIKLKKEARKYITIDRTTNKSEILKIILNYLNENGFDNNLNDFSNKIYNMYIRTFKNENNTPILNTALIYHLNTELIIPHLGTFIYLDSKWYKLRENFINEMNTRCLEIFNISGLNNEILNETWDMGERRKRSREDVYNDKYLKPNYLVLDKIIIDSIELADIIHIKEGVLYLCHVKYGFSTELRELYSQIISSARRLKNDLKDENNEYLKSIYNGLVNKERNNNLSQDEFINLFKNNSIKYVMSITGHLKNRPLIENINSYKSNIAKLSLIQCYTEMRTDYYDLNIEIINNQNCFE